MVYSLGCSAYRSHQHYTCAPPLSARAYGKHSPTHKGGKPLKKTKITKQKWKKTAALKNSKKSCKTNKHTGNKM